MSSCENALEVSFESWVWGGLKKRLSQFSYLNVRDVGLYFGALLTHIVVSVLYLVSICHL